MVSAPVSLQYRSHGRREATAMMIHIFKGIDRVFACTAESSGSSLPEKFGPWEAFKSLELNRGQAQPGINVEECLDDIETFGVHLTKAHVRITAQALS